MAFVVLILVINCYFKIFLLTQAVYSALAEKQKKTTERFKFPLEL